MKKIKYKIGDVFAVPLENEFYGIGIIIRINKIKALTYYFDYLSKDLPELDKLPSEIFDKVKFISIITSKNSFENWSILGNKLLHYLENPILKFSKDETYRIAEYSENLETNNMYYLTSNKEEYYNLPEDGLAGYIWLEKVLYKVLTGNGEKFLPIKGYKL